jgi:plasmid stabilization system protein ParE
MKIRLLPNAERDLEIAADFYGAQSDGLGEYFIASLISDIESVKLFAGTHHKSFGFHRAISKRFPFATYYLVKERTVYVYAILDCRRDPKTTEDRLRDDEA